MKNGVGQSVRMFSGVLLMLMIAAGFPPLATGADQKQDLERVRSRLVEEVRHQLIMLPFYDVFDYLEFELRDMDTVVLKGQVTRPTLKSDAENVISRLEGVGKVVNEIEVLPLSSNDDRIRLRVYRAIFSQAGLERYAMRAVPPIHILVKNGRVTLKGFVANEMEKNLAGLKASGVSGVFSVANEIQVEKRAS